MKKITALAESDLLFKEVEGKNKSILKMIYDYSDGDELNKIECEKSDSRSLKKLINEYNKKLEELEKLDLDRNFVNAYSKIYEMEHGIVTSGRGDSVNFEDIMQRKTLKAVNEFRGLKQYILDGLKEAKATLEKKDDPHEFKGAEQIILDAKLKKDASEAIVSLKKSFKNFKIMRGKIKSKAEKSGVFTSSTFLHTVFNYKNSGDEYTGMMGSLITLRKSIENYRSESGKEAYKILKTAKKQFEKGNKSFDRSLKLYKKIVDGIDKDKSSKSNILVPIGVINDIEKSVNDMVIEHLNRLDNLESFKVSSLKSLMISFNKDLWNLKKESKSKVKDVNKSIPTKYVENFVEICYEAKMGTISKQIKKFNMIKSMCNVSYAASIIPFVIALACVIVGLVLPPIALLGLILGSILFINLLIGVAMVEIPAKIEKEQKMALGRNISDRKKSLNSNVKTNSSTEETFYSEPYSVEYSANYGQDSHGNSFSGNQSMYYS